MKWVFLVPILCFNAVTALAAATIVDDSQNYTMDQPYGDEEPMVRNMPTETKETDLEYGNEAEKYTHNKPLAHESSEHTVADSANLINRLQALEQELHKLRGQLEVQSHELKTLKEQQLSFYKDLDSRINAPSAAKPNNNPPKTIFAPTSTSNTSNTSNTSASASVNNPNEATATLTHNTNPADEQIQYLAAYDLIKSKQYKEATLAMQKFATRFPHSGYKPNAEYWLGELYLMQKNYPDAITHFQTVVQRFPTSSKSGPSLLKIAYALDASGKRPEAIINLKQVIQQFPNTASAKMAQKKLDSLIV